MTRISNSDDLLEIQQRRELCELPDYGSLSFEYTNKTIKPLVPAVAATINESVQTVSELGTQVEVLVAAPATTSTAIKEAAAPEGATDAAVKRIQELEVQLAIALSSTKKPSGKKTHKLKIANLELELEQLLVEKETWLKKISNLEKYKELYEKLFVDYKQTQEQTTQLQNLTKSQAETIESISKLFQESSAQQNQLQNDLLTSRNELQSINQLFNAKLSEKEIEWKNLLEKELNRKTMHEAVFEDWIRCIKRAGVEHILGQEIDLSNASMYRSCLYPVLSRFMDEFTNIKIEFDQLTEQKAKLLLNHTQLTEKHLKDVSEKDLKIEKLEKTIQSLHSTLEQEKIEKVRVEKRLEAAEKDLKTSESEYQLLKTTRETNSQETIERANTQIRNIRLAFEQERAALTNQIENLLKDKVELQSKVGRLEREKLHHDFELKGIHQTIQQERLKVKNIMGI